MTHLLESEGEVADYTLTFEAPGPGGGQVLLKPGGDALAVTDANKARSSCSLLLPTPPMILGRAA